MLTHCGHGCLDTACSDRACGTFWELNDFIAVFNRLNSIGRERLVLHVTDLGTVN